MMDVLRNSIETYTKNIGMILFFSIPFLLSLVLLLPPFSPAPVFSALGAYFLRSGSIPEMTPFDILIIVLSAGISLFFISLAAVAVTLVVKSSRTRTKVSAEAMRNLGSYTIMVFAIFAAIKIIEFLFLSYLLSLNADEFPALIVNFIFSFGLFYIAPAVVLEEKKPVPALISSFNHIARMPINFIFWLLVAFVLIYVFSSFSFMMFSDPMMRQGFIILMNSAIVLPFLVVLQAHLYLSKYTIVR
ncbi:MAG: hypothetical protein NZ903_03335 [Candidatus Micrarchaeota archaeon]|nr:hypothetical protein [Candidatus Micrarchaeota archaeon]